jgi:hypothetical protein
LAYDSASHFIYFSVFTCVADAVVTFTPGSRHLIPNQQRLQGASRWGGNACLMLMSLFVAMTTIKVTN